MRKIQRISIVTIFVLFLSIIGRAQVLTIHDYRFLEINVFDSKGESVSEAKVKTPNNFNSKKNDAFEQETNQNGKIEFRRRADIDLPYSLFSISKAGYFTFNDLGGYEIPRDNRKTTINVELLKIPQTEAENQILGDEQLKREFFRAAKTGDAETVTNLLKKGISPNLRTSDLRGIPGKTDVPAIMIAATAGSGQVIKALLDAGGNIQPKEEPFNHILETYLRAGPFVFNRKPENEYEQTEMLRRYNQGFEVLAKAGIIFNSDPKRLDDLISLAAYEGYYGAVKVFLEQGLPPDYTSGDGETVLMKAALHAFTPYNSQAVSKIETVNLLLKAGADPNAVRSLPNSGCETALMNAARGDVESVRALIKGGAKINFRCGSEYALTSAVNNDNAKGVKYLLDAGADPAVFGRNGESLLPNAADGSVELIKTLIDYGFPLDGKNADGETALIIAIKKDWNEQDDEITNALLKAGANPNVVAENESLGIECETPLMIAAMDGKIEIIKTLIAKKASVKFVCQNGTSVLTAAVESPDPIELFQLLIKNGADVRGKQGRLALKYLENLRKDYLESSQNMPHYNEIKKLLEAAGAKE